MYSQLRQKKSLAQEEEYILQQPFLIMKLALQVPSNKFLILLASSLFTHYCGASPSANNAPSPSRQVQSKVPDLSSTLNKARKREFKLQHHVLYTARYLRGRSQGKTRGGRECSGWRECRGRRGAEVQSNVHFTTETTVQIPLLNLEYLHLF